MMMIFWALRLGPFGAEGTQGNCSVQVRDDPSRSSGGSSYLYHFLKMIFCLKDASASNRVLFE